MDKDKRGFARMEEDRSSRSLVYISTSAIIFFFVLTLSRERFILSCISWSRFVSVGVSHFQRLMYVCVNFFRC